MILVDGKKIAAEIKHEVAAEVAFLQDNHDITPHVAILVVSDDEKVIEESHILEKAFHEVGFMYSAYRQPEDTTEFELMEIIQFLNMDDEVDGIILQLPLPVHINSEKVIQTIAVGKDVECVHPSSVSNTFNTSHTFQPMLFHALRQIINRTGLDLKNKTCSIVEKQGSADAQLLQFFNQYTLTRSHTSVDPDILGIYENSDILIIDIDSAAKLNGDQFKANSVVIDLGHHKLLSKDTESGFLFKGDVKVDSRLQKCAHLILFEESIKPILHSAILHNALIANKRKLN